MPSDKPSLTSGLDAILKLHQSMGEADTYPVVVEEKLSYLSVHQLVPGAFQPRKNFSEEALQELAQSIQFQGILQPIIVRKISNQTFEIIAGERRWRAAQLAGLTQVPVLIKPIDDRVACAFSLVENIQRKDLNALEEAEALYRLHHEFHLSHEKIAESIGRSRVFVTNSLRLLTLSEKVKHAVLTEALSMGHARALVGLPSAEQERIAALVIDKALSVRQIEALVRERPHAKKTDSFSPLVDTQLQDWQQQLAAFLGDGLVIKRQKRGHYYLTLKLDSKCAVEQLLTRLKAV